MKKCNTMAGLAVLTFATALASPAVLADEYRVTITNLTAGQSFTPMLVVSHRRDVHLFSPGEMASPEIEAIAEGGDTGPMQAMLDSSPDVQESVSTGGLLGPGESVTVSLEGGKRFRNISLRCPPWRAKRRRVVPGSREATRDTRRAEGAKGDPKGASERGVQSYGRPVCSRNELAMLWRNAG